MSEGKTYLWAESDVSEEWHGGMDRAACLAAARELVDPDCDHCYIAEGVRAELPRTGLADMIIEHMNLRLAAEHEPFYDDIAIDPSKEVTAALDASIAQTIRIWAARHGIRVGYFIVQPDTIERVAI